MGRKIIDCFTFYNELDLLTYKLNVLNDIVDYKPQIKKLRDFYEKILIVDHKKQWDDHWKSASIHRNKSS